jgi:ribosomal protein L16 Arg81 hydroxylase
LKEITVFDGQDRTLLNDAQLERFHHGSHRNLEYRDEFARQGRTFVLEPGDGLHIPVTSPHWVKNGPAVSVSFSITFRSRSSNRRASVYRVNSILRANGLDPTPPGKSPFRDALKVIVDRSSDKLRRMLRRHRQL